MDHGELLPVESNRERGGSNSPTERHVTRVTVKISLYALLVAPAIRPEPRRHSTPSPSSAPTMVTILCRFSPSSVTSSVMTPPLKRALPASSKYRYLKPCSGLAASFHATLKWGMSSLARPRRAPELAER